VATMAVGYVILQALRDLCNLDLLNLWLAKFKKTKKKQKNFKKEVSRFFEKRAQFFSA
jgi:hypothetical protein